MVTRWLVGVALLCSLSFVFPMAACAEDQAPEVEGSQPIRDNLKKRIGSRVTLRLAAGEEIGGKVVAVGEHAVHLSELAGKEFFDAVIRLDQVSAVVVRAREK